MRRPEGNTYPADYNPDFEEADSGMGGWGDQTGIRNLPLAPLVGLGLLAQGFSPGRDCQLSTYRVSATNSEGRIPDNIQCKAISPL